MHFCRKIKIDKYPVLAKRCHCVGGGKFFLSVVCNARTALHYLENDVKVEFGPNLSLA